MSPSRLKVTSEVLPQEKDYLNCENIPAAVAALLISVFYSIFAFAVIIAKASISHHGCELNM